MCKYCAPITAVCLVLLLVICVYYLFAYILTTWGEAIRNVIVPECNENKDHSVNQMTKTP